MEKLTAQDVKKKLQQMRQDFVRVARRYLAKCAALLTDFATKLIADCAVHAEEKKPEKEPTLPLKGSTNLNHLPVTLIRETFTRLSMAQNKRLKGKKPEEMIFICGPCARRKNMKKAPQVWVSDGTCDFCLERSFICQALEYADVENHNLH